MQSSLELSSCAHPAPPPQIVPAAMWDAAIVIQRAWQAYKEQQFAAIVIQRAWRWWIWGAPKCEWQRPESFLVWNSVDCGRPIPHLHHKLCIAENGKYAPKSCPVHTCPCVLRYTELETLPLAPLTTCLVCFATFCDSDLCTAESHASDCIAGMNYH